MPKVLQKNAAYILALQKKIADPHYIDAGISRLAQVLSARIVELQLQKQKRK